MSFELPTELIDKIMEEAKEPIHKKLLKLDLFDLTCLKLELNRIYDMKCENKREELRKYKDCIVNINGWLYSIECINKRELRCKYVFINDGTDVIHTTKDGLKLSLEYHCRYKRVDRKNNIEYFIYNYWEWIKYEDIKTIDLVFDIPLFIFNYNRGIKD